MLTFIKEVDRKECDWKKDALEQLPGKMYTLGFKGVGLDGKEYGTFSYLTEDMLNSLKEYVKTI